MRTCGLPNPRNDAEDVAAALKRSGFETFIGLDLDKAGMDDDVEIRFGRAARNADDPQAGLVPPFDGSPIGQARKTPG